MAEPKLNKGNLGVLLAYCGFAVVIAYSRGDRYVPYLFDWNAFWKFLGTVYVFGFFPYLMGMIYPLWEMKD